MVNAKELQKIASPYSILLVEDDKVIAKSLISYLSDIFKEVKYAQNGEDALELYKQNEFAIVLSDKEMPKMNGLDMSYEIKKINPNQNIIITTSYTDAETFLSSIKLGIDGFIIKPINFVDMNNLFFKLITKIKKFNENDINIEQQKILLNQVRINNNQLREYSEILNQVAIVSKTDKEGNITYVNDIFCEVSGYTREELIGNSHNVVGHPDVPKAIFQTLWGTIEKGETWQGTIKNRTKNGDTYFLLATIIPMYDKTHENIIGYMGIRFLTTKEENEKREFKKKVIHEYTDMRKSNTESKKKIELLEIELNLIRNEWQFYQDAIKTLREKNMKLLSQTKFYEDEIDKNSTNYRKVLKNSAVNSKKIYESYKKSMMKIEMQESELAFMKSDDKSRKKQILGLDEKLSEQRDIILDLKNTIKHISERQSDSNR